MDTHELANWIREEHHKVDELSSMLRERAGVIPHANVAEWIVDVRDRFEHFRAHLMRHMALEEHEGYMAGVVRKRPALSEVVERLRHEHREVGKIMDGVSTALTNVEVGDRLLIRDLSCRILNLIQVVEHHEADENLMLLSVFTNDIGTKD